jgi:hypothetical protein
MSFTYECNLEIPAWTPSSEMHQVMRYRPRVIFTRYEFSPDSFELLVRISSWVDDRPGRDRWVVQFYPPDQTDLRRQDDDGDYWKRRRWPRHLDPELAEGELRHPRDTAAAAIKLGLELLVDIAPNSDLGAMEKVAALLRGPLEQTTRAYLTRFRPVSTR